MGRGGGSSGRAGVSTPSGRGAQSPTEQAWTVTQHQGPARSGRAGAVTRFRWAQPGAVTPRLSPTILRSVDGHAIPQRGHNRGHHPSAESAPCTTRTHRGHGQRRGPWTPALPWTQTARPQELAKPQRTRFRTAPTAILFLFIKIHREDPVLDRVAGVEIDRAHNPSSPP